MTAMRSRSIFLVAWCLLVLLPSLVSAQTSVSLQSGDDQAHLRWLSETLTSVPAIKAGMTRRDLLTFDQMLALNLRSGYVLLRAVVPVMLKQGNGSIVNVASRAAFDHAAGAA